jgi:hypothetical protein
LEWEKKQNKVPAIPTTRPMPCVRFSVCLLIYFLDKCIGVYLWW